MRIQGCEFPDDCLYDEEGLMWARLEPGGDAVVGITSILAAIAGKLTAVKAKPIGAENARGRSIGSIEGGRYFGTLRSPVGGVLVAVNDEVLRKPKILSELPYSSGWFARVRPTNLTNDEALLKSAEGAADLLESQIRALHARCFAAFPDYEMFEIGVECAAVLVRLNEVIARIEVGEVIHIVSDDATAPVEIAQWSEETGQPVVDARREGNLFHYLVRKVR